MIREKTWICPSLDQSTWAEVQEVCLNKDGRQRQKFELAAAEFGLNRGRSEFAVTVVSGNPLHEDCYAFSNLDNAQKFYAEKTASRELFDEDASGLREVSLHVNQKLVRLSTFPPNLRMSETERREWEAEQNYERRTAQPWSSDEELRQRIKEAYEAYLKERGITEEEYFAEYAEQEQINSMFDSLDCKLRKLRHDYTELSNEQFREAMEDYVHHDLR